MGRYGLERPSEIWTYNNLDIPGFPASFDFEFVDFNGTGNFELVQDIDTAASVWNQFGTVNNALDAIAQRRQVIGEVDPATGMDRYRDVDGTRQVMREFDLQQRVDDVMKTPERTLPSLRTEVQARAAFGNLAVTAAVGAVWVEGERARVPVQIAVPYGELSYRDDGERVLYDIDYVIVASMDDGWRSTGSRTSSLSLSSPINRKSSWRCAFRSRRSSRRRRGATASSRTFAIETGTASETWSFHSSFPLRPRAPGSP
jgi:hypothetical protein